MTFNDLIQVVQYNPGIGGSNVMVTGLPAQTFLNETYSGSLVRVDLLDEAGQPESFVRPLGVIHKRDEELTDAAEHFLRLLARHANDPPAPLPRNGHNNGSANGSPRAGAT